jgi:hypothetical protein
MLENSLANLFGLSTSTAVFSYDGLLDGVLLSGLLCLYIGCFVLMCCACRLDDTCGIACCRRHMSALWGRTGVCLFYFRAFVEGVCNSFCEDVGCACVACH